MDSRRLGRVHIIDTNRQPEKCIFGSGCTIAVLSDFFVGALTKKSDLLPKRGSSTPSSVTHMPDFSDLWVRLVFMRLSRPPPVKVL